jgi:hypothetical protein
LSIRLTRGFIRPRKVSLLSFPFVKQHLRQRNPQIDGFNRTLLDTTIAVKADIRIGDMRDLTVFRTEVDVLRTNIHTLTAGDAFDWIKDRGHNLLLLQAAERRLSAPLSGHLTVSAAWQEVAPYSSRHHLSFFAIEAR